MLKTSRDPKIPLNNFQTTNMEPHNGKDKLDFKFTHEYQDKEMGFLQHVFTIVLKVQGL